MNPFKLFKLKNEVETALELAINEQGEIVDESALALWENSLEDKNGYLLDMACEVKNLEAEAEAIKNTEKSLKERRTFVENKLERIKAFMQSQMTPGEKLSDGRVKISWRKSSPVVIDRDAPEPKDADPSLVNVSYEFSKTAIKEALESGKKIEWASIKEIQNIQIK